MVRYLFFNNKNKSSYIYFVFILLRCKIYMMAFYISRVGITQDILLLTM